jgi:alpha-amylase
MSGNDTTGGSTRRGVLKGITALGAAAVGGSALSGSGAAQIEDSAVYQYYHTDWTTIRDNLAAVAEAGYDAIQVPPAQFSRLYEYERQSNAEVYEQPLGYQPIDYRNFDSVFGTESEYQAMVDEAHNQGLEVIADAVMNHMAAGGDYFDRQVSLADIPQFSSQDFHPSCGIDYNDPESVEDCWLVGLRDLDQDSSYVRGQLYNYLEKYANLGVDGVRFDAAKHISESFFRNYANQWADDLGLYKVGEVLDGSTAVNQGYADTGMSVTDYALYFTMREDVFTSSGDMNALDGAGLVNQDPARAMTFVSNHDQGPPEYERLAYAYILTYEGYPRVYNHRIGPSDGEISTLLSIRRQLLSGSATTRYVDTDLYVFERGDAIVVLNRGSGQRSATVQTNFAAGATLSDVTGSAADTTVDSNGYAQVTAPAVGYAVYSTQSLDGGSGSGDDGGTTGTTLRIEAPTADGESVYFTGSTSGLTDWGGGVEGTESNGVWEVTIQDTGDFQWKTRRGPAGGTGDVWEAGDNHTSANTNPTHNGWEDGFTEGDGSSDSGAPVQDGGTYRLVNVNSGKTLDVEGGTGATANGDDVHQWDYFGSANQHWTIESVGDGYYRLIAEHSGKALDVSGGESATQDGANVHQWEYLGNGNQQWAIEASGSGYRLVARHSGKVLGIDGGSTENGGTAIQWEYNGNPDQHWTFEQV